jgi:hypothetical protein
MPPRAGTSSERAALARYVRLFNAGRFFEAHEVLEKAWRNGQAHFLKGLIHIAVALLHYRRGNRHGMLVKLKSGMALTCAHAPEEWKNEISRLLPLWRGMEAMVLAQPGKTLPILRQIPRIRFPETQFKKPAARPRKRPSGPSAASWKK